MYVHQDVNWFSSQMLHAHFQQSLPHLSRHVPDGSLVHGIRKALRSAGGYARSHGRIETKRELMEPTERSMILGASWRLSNVKSSMLQENNPHAACTHEIHPKRTERKSSCCILLRSELKGNKSLAHHTSAVWVLLVVLYSKYKNRKRQLWVRPIEWLKLNFASCAIRQTRSLGVLNL